MAPRDSSIFNNGDAQNLVFENLGLSAEELGVGDDFADDTDEGEGDDLGDEGDDLGDEGDDDPFSRDVQDLRDVSHTERGRQPRERPRGREQLAPQRRGQPQQLQVKPDKKGNLVDASGKIVARAGPEARLYTDRYKARQQVAQRDTQLRETAGRLTRITSIAQRLKAENDAYAAQTATMEKLGLAAEDQISAFQLFSQLKKDAKGTLTKLLTRAAANGIVIDGQQQANSQTGIADMLKEVLGERLKPIETFVTSQQQREQQMREANAERIAVDREVEDFFQANPDAQAHASTFSRVLRDPRFSRMSLGEVWARIQLNLIKNPPRRDSGQRTRGGQRQLPRGRRGSPPSGRGYAPEGDSQIADVNATYGDIINDLLDQHGV